MRGGDLRLVEGLHLTGVVAGQVVGSTSWAPSMNVPPSGIARARRSCPSSRCLDFELEHAATPSVSTSARASRRVGPNLRFTQVSQ